MAAAAAVPLHIACRNQCPQSIIAPAPPAPREDLLVSSDALSGCLHTGNASGSGRLHHPRTQASVETGFGLCVKVNIRNKRDCMV